MRTLLALAAVLLCAGEAAAQIRGSADVGMTTLAASQSFDAILGTHRGVVFGGGVELDVRDGLFVSLRASRFKQDGHRVFMFEGERFDLGIPTTVTIRPVALSGGYRFRASGRFIPYGGGGISWYRYQESSEGAAAAEDVDEQFTGFQGFGGVEFRLARLLAVAGEAEWAIVRDALGYHISSVATTFGEHDLGGFSVRAKVVLGR